MFFMKPKARLLMNECVKKTVVSMKTLKFILTDVAEIHFLTILDHIDIINRKY